jgi:uncharacterized protein YjbI with pentapeptide repeats
MYSLSQQLVDRGEFALLQNAAEAGETIDARGLNFNAGRLKQMRDCLPLAAEGRPYFDQWQFAGATFEDACDLGGCQFQVRSFDGCQFGQGVSFADSVFSRARFRRARFGDDANLERVDFGVRADFHSASFGDRARFSHSLFFASQFFAAVFGEEAGFSGAAFGVSTRFHSARFGPRANFTKARFEGRLDFGAAFFGEKFQMMKAQFGSDPTFVGATFGPRARLTDWKVAGALNMRSAHFLGPVTLHGLEVGTDATFDYATFEDSIDLGDTLVNGDAYLHNVTINAAERFGPLHVIGDLDLRSAVVRSPCAFVLSAAELDFSDARFFSPAQLLIGSGDIVLERLESGARLVITTPQPVGVEFTRPRLLSVRGADLSGVLISGLDVRPLRFEGAEGIDELRIESGDAFEYAPRGRRAHREAIAEEHGMRAPKGGWYPTQCQPPSKVDPAAVGRVELARIYRGLRKAREDSRDAPGAADFYYGEMEMRRLDSRARLREWSGPVSYALHAGTYLLLELYRLCGGYGVRPSRPLLLFASLALIAAAVVDSGDLIHYLEVVEKGKDAVPMQAGFEQCLVFVLRSALLLPTSASVTTATGAEWIQIAARILGPILLGLFAFGMRARVHR